MSNNALNQLDENQKAIIEALAAATTKVLAETKPLEIPKPTTTTKLISETTDSEKVTPVDSPEIDLENEPIQKKRERQRSLVLNLENIIPATPSDPSALDQRRRSFCTQVSSKPSFKGHHADSSSDEEDEKEKKTTSTSGEIDEETSDTGAKDINYDILHDDTIEDFSFSSAREQAKKRFLRDQQEIMLKQTKEQE